MITANSNYQKLSSSYLFVEITRRINEFTATKTHSQIIRLGIGDVTLPLTPSIIEALHQGIEDMATSKNFKGYGPENGYLFLRKAMAQREYGDLPVDIDEDDIIVSDGAKCDVANFQELFSQDITIAIPDPVYPVYVEANVMAGRTGEFSKGRYKGLTYLDAHMENDFLPPPPSEKNIALIYLCFPNNPTGAVADHALLTKYVNYALEHKALLLFDAAYCHYIAKESTLPRSIFEIPGATKCAVEFRSLSKTAGFTGLRCACTVIHDDCRIFSSKSEEIPLKPLWLRRQSTKFNGVAYPIQRAAQGAYSEQGWHEIQGQIAYYMKNAEIIRKAFSPLPDYSVYGGVHAPYIWIETKHDSWELFTRLLHETSVVVTPGAGFGQNGAHAIRISAFNDREKVTMACSRITERL